MIQCEKCSGVIPEGKPKNQRFCSVSCAISFNNSKRARKIGTCQECGKEYLSPRKGQKFCSHSCAANYSNVRRDIVNIRSCLVCGVDIRGGRKIYCSIDCSAKARKNKAIESWHNDPNSTNTKYGISKSISIYLKEQAGWRCQSPNCCVSGGWSEINPATGTVPVEIDHIDGNAYNNHPDNLIVLCPNCHSLTENYRALNKQGTRKYRNKKISSMK